ncbi:hypothetical protein EV182_006262 [Spiromyces aspiralis]|uniref:Uncharacterized protein n=1 Tax=Spiromyces aspiralis TaxID=68401 RepID=A0ACC1HQ73_9FUNG|nr:hypothetical protein EV182_006262 [Spiromyces aspiralis]
MDHPELLEGGGEVGTDWRAKSAKDDVSTSGEEFTDDSSTDSDDDIEDGFPEMTGVTGGWSSALNSQFMIPGQGGQHGVGLASEVSPEYTQSLNKHRLQRHVPGYHSNGMRPLGSEEGGREAESDDDDDQPLISVMRKKNTASIKTKLS